MAAVDADELAKVERERDLYLQLLKLGRQGELEPFLEEALQLVVEVVGARQGYLELYDDEESERAPRWWIAHGFSDAELRDVRTSISRGVIAAAVASGETVVSHSALLDQRFKERESVIGGRIGAVLCAPIGDDPPRGALYLQGRVGSLAFSEEDRQRAELFAAHLAPQVDRLVAGRRQRERDNPTRSLRERLNLPGVVGSSPALAAVLQQVGVVAPLDVTVLLTGENGTGKSLIARVVHENGPRASGPFVELSCAALPESLIESELFGALPGAHSTAVRRIEGKVAAAEGGTLFLDEIGDLPLGAQAKLLQLLQSKVYYPLGASQPASADIRVIAATNVELEQAVAEHRFREDLFYRLQVMPIRLPRLAERRADIRELAVAACRRACERHKLAPLELSRNALRAAEAAEWPGNVRQLEHTVEAAVIRAASEASTAVEQRHLFPASSPPSAPTGGLTFQEATRQFQRELLRTTLQETGWNVVETARNLDLARSHVYNLIRGFGLERTRP
ncbi:MAG: sigma-54-dependent Fis family transcriptional regulator [Deltaproteobacteria bacterium]|nr:sigma-54-dependent Fis family transcriptional regulator [Deltaproteobacteria bacterium]